jgi:hypothetical protein
VVKVRCDISQNASFLHLHKFGAFWMASSKNMLKISPWWPESADHPQFHPNSNTNITPKDFRVT